ncbi:MAG: hypothetical protein JW384_02800 [Nitrosomonadaceae bacterium]|nr:hypothetical protein [Nitrosomonadaceae bacterium]
MADIYSLLAGLLADRPAPIEENRGYYAWDQGKIYVVTGGAWVEAIDIAATMNTSMSVREEILNLKDTINSKSTLADAAAIAELPAKFNLLLAILRASKIIST